ncbi:redoxin domain-containing protein [Sediminibacterium sp.]|uniref:redoxin domain-containing protein n=1 Tax=Sediminibacterium sp. TaxID=1917865 RepID=UPI003F718905
MRFLMIVILILSQLLDLYAQQKPVAAKASISAKKPIVKRPVNTSGREIAITLTPLKNCTVYLGSYFGKGMTLVDSARLDQNSKGVFKGPKKLTTGIYFVVSPSYTIQFELLMDEKQQFSILADTSAKESVIINGSPDNDLFKDYASFSNVKGRTLQELKKALQAANGGEANQIKLSITATEKEIKQYQSNIHKKYPQSLLSALFHIMQRPELPPVPVVNGKPDSVYPYQYVKQHFWDNVLFNEDRLLRTPFFEPKLDEYFKYYVSADPDSIIVEVKQMLLMAKTGKEIYPYLLTKFTNKYIQPEFMGQDKVFVYLFENFYAKGDTVLLNPASRKSITERAYSLMANQIGQQAPVLNLTDTSGKKIGLYSIKAPFTIVTFWDPNCGHCKDEIPRYDSIYKAKWKMNGVAIYSVNIYENENTAWKKFITDKQLSSDWYQVYQTKEDKMAEEKAGLPNYRQLYDIFKTPTVYLLDDKKRILAKQLSLEQFDALMDAKKR